MYTTHNRLLIRSETRILTIDNCDERKIATGVGSLLRLPTELVYMILCFLKTNDLLHFEQVCKGAKQLALPAFRTAYGPGPRHRQKADDRALACEQLKLEQSIQDTIDPVQVLKKLLEKFGSDKSNVKHWKSATKALIKLRLRRSNTPSWNEAVAVALMIQGRYEESAQYYAKIEDLDEAACFRRFQVKCRFGGPCLEYPDILSKARLGRAMECAARLGDLDLLQELADRGGHWKHAAKGAAAMGHIHILEFLARNHVEVLDEDALAAAMRNSQSAATALLLELEIDIQLHGYRSLLMKKCIERGDIKFLRVVFSRRPGWGREPSTIGYLLDHSNYNVCTAILEVLIEEAKFAVNAVNSMGQSVLHIAVESQKVALARAVLDCRPDTHMLDGTGQSPAELAFNTGNTEMSALFAPVNLDPFQEKKEISRQIITSSRKSFCELLVAGEYAENFLGTTIDEKVASAETLYIEVGLDLHLTDVWVTAFSAQALEEYRKTVSGSKLEHIFHCVRKSVQSSRRDVMQSVDLSALGDLGPRLVRAIFALCPFIREDEVKTAAFYASLGSSIEDLGFLVAFFESPFGDRWSNGNRRKWKQETLAVIERLGLPYKSEPFGICV